MVCSVAGGCAEAREETDPIPARMAEGGEDYCALPPFDLDVLARRPGPDAPPIDDVNWFARPVPHAGDAWIVAFASHDQNYLYDLSADRRIRIPDRSDAVATPDGRYMTVPSNYTPDSNIRFYAVAPMLEALAEGRDAADLEPAFVHDHPAMHRVYYQSTALLGERSQDGVSEIEYRLMFSGTGHDSAFRIVDYVFRHDAETGALLDAQAGPPMAICPAVRNDLNTPFISKDGRYVAAYTSPEGGNTYASGASLKVFEITSVDPEAGTTTCAPVADFGFAAGKADFSFDNSMLTFHSSQGAYLTPFVNGGLPVGTITDVFVARFETDSDNRILGVRGVQRLSTSIESGIGSYFPAFFADGGLFFLTNTLPRGAKGEPRFEFRVGDPASRGWRTALPADPAIAALWTELGGLWEQACTPRLGLAGDPFPLDPHELPLQAMSLDVPQCEALVRDAVAAGDTDREDALLGICRAAERQ